MDVRTPPLIESLFPEMLCDLFDMVAIDATERANVALENDAHGVDF